MTRGRSPRAPPGRRRDLGLARLDPPAGQRPQSAARLVAPLDQQQAAVVALDDRAHAADGRSVGHTDSLHHSRSLRRPWQALTPWPGRRPTLDVADQRGGRHVCHPAVCPLPAAPSARPGLWSSSWQCDEHGDTLPFFDVAVPVRGSARPAAGSSPGCRSGCRGRFRPAGASVPSAGRATSAPVRARRWSRCCGPAPLGGAAEVAVRRRGAGRRAGGAPRRPAGRSAGGRRGPGEAKVIAGQASDPLWALPGASEERVAYAGEAKGVWLSLVFWPRRRSLLLIEHMLLADLRDLPAGPNDVPRPDLRGAERPALDGRRRRRGLRPRPRGRARPATPARSARRAPSRRRARPASASAGTRPSRVRRSRTSSTVSAPSARSAHTTSAPSTRTPGATGAASGGSAAMRARHVGGLGAVAAHQPRRAPERPDRARSGADQRRGPG